MANKDINDYPCTLIRLKSVYAMTRDEPYKKSILRMESLPSKQTEKQYETFDGNRIKKSQLLKIRAIPTNPVMEFEVYCLPGNMPQAKQMISEAVSREVERVKQYLERLHTTVSSGFTVMTRDEYMDFVRSNMKSASRSDPDEMKL